MVRLRVAIAAGVFALVSTQTLPSLRAADSPRRLVLLVGAARYPNLDKRMWLDGPENDAALLATFLRYAPFNVPESDITVLAGWPDDAAKRPTKANIARAFQRLAQSAKPGDLVFIAMAGHGSQQPSSKSLAEEPDGLDELFLPADVGKWDGKAGAVKNAIADSEIHAWLDAIRKTGAFVWIMFDSCHSGTMTRGGSFERARELRPEDLGIPDEAIRAANAGAARTRGGSASESPSLGIGDDAHRVSADFAADESASPTS